MIRKPTIFFKMNAHWLKYEAFTMLVKKKWMPYDSRLGVFAAGKFADNVQHF